MSMQHPSKEGFEAFVKQQPATEMIDHFGGWQTCAIGRYAEEINWTAFETADFLQDAYGAGWEREFSPEREDTIFDVLNYSGRVPLYKGNTRVWGEFNDYDVSTYGALAVLIDEFNKRKAK